MRAVPTFRRGAVPTAGDFSQLVAAVRELLDAQGLTHVIYRRQPRRLYFVTAGSCVARMGADGEPVGVAAEWLWQCGERVNLLPGAQVEGFKEALERAEGYGAATGLHGTLTVKEHGYGMLFDLEATSVEYKAAAWIEQPPSADGTLDLDLLHGDALAGCVMAAANVLHQRQQGVCMWPQPQYPALVWRQLHDVPPSVSGSEYLLPCTELRQVLGWTFGGFYEDGASHSGVFTTVWHCWMGRLDMWGQLHFGAENLGE